MIRRNRHKARTIHRIRAGGITNHVRYPMHRLNQMKRYFNPTGFTDPVALHQLHLGRPVIQMINRFQQFLGIIADLKEPLRQLTPLDLRARSPALTVNHLLIRQHGHIHRIPVHHRLFAIHQPFIHKVDEHALLLAVVFRITGRKFAAPVQRPAHRLHLRLHVGDILIGPFFRMPARRHRRIFRRHPERVPAHRVQHVMPGGYLIARHNVAHRIVAHMPHMDAPGRIRKHL